MESGFFSAILARDFWIDFTERSSRGRFDFASTFPRFSMYR